MTFNFDFEVCRLIVSEYRACYWYLSVEKFYEFVGTIMQSRRHELHITADFAPALRKCDIPEFEEWGYVKAAAKRFNVKGEIIKSGSSFGIRWPEPKQLSLPF